MYNVNQNRERISLPQDQSNEKMQLTPARTAIAQLYDTTISSSTEITLNSATSLLEITAIDDGIFMKYGTDDVTNANFDEFIASGSTRHYTIPMGVTAINLIDTGASGKVVVIQK